MLNKSEFKRLKAEYLKRQLTGKIRTIRLVKGFERKNPDKWKNYARYSFSNITKVGWQYNYLEAYA